MKVYIIIFIELYDWIDNIWALTVEALTFKEYRPYKYHELF